MTRKTEKMAKGGRVKDLGWKRIWAIMAGFLTGAVLSLGTDQILHAMGVYPNWGQDRAEWLFVLAAAYRFIFNVLGCYIAAKLAPVKPMWHAMVIGWLGLALGSAGVIATWNAVPSIGPHWYGVVVALMSLPCAWLGGKLYVLRSGGKP